MNRASCQQSVVSNQNRLCRKDTSSLFSHMDCAPLALVPVTSFREALPETGKLLVQLLFGEKPDIRPDEFDVYHTHAEIIERESVYTLDSSCKSQVSRHINKQRRSK